MTTRIRRFNDRNLPDSRFRLYRQVTPGTAPPNEAGADPRAASTPIRLVPTIAICPLQKYWRVWDLFGSDYRELSADEHRRCAAARRLLPLESRGVAILDWEFAEDDARFRPMTPEESGQPDWKFAPASPAHVHAELVVDGYAVHIDWLHATKYGPGRSYDEVRLFVDGRLAGRGGRCGCALGFGGNDLPAVAAIGQNAAVSVGLDASGTRVELWTAHLVGRM